MEVVPFAHLLEVGLGIGIDSSNGMAAVHKLKCIFVLHSNSPAAFFFAFGPSTSVQPICFMSQHLCPHCTVVPHVVVMFPYLLYKHMSFGLVCIVINMISELAQRAYEHFVVSMYICLWCKQQDINK